MAFGQRNAFGEHIDDLTGDFTDFITGLSSVFRRKRRKSGKKHQTRHRRVKRRSTRQYEKRKRPRQYPKRGGFKGKSSRHGKRPYPYWLKKYMFKKK